MFTTNFFLNNMHMTCLSTSKCQYIEFSSIVQIHIFSFKQLFFPPVLIDKSEKNRLPKVINVYLSRFYLLPMPANTTSVDHGPAHLCPLLVNALRFTTQSNRCTYCLMHTDSGSCGLTGPASNAGETRSSSLAQG